MQPNDTSPVRTISHLLFVDLDGRRQVAAAAPETIFDKANRATIALTNDPDGFKLCPVTSNSQAPEPAKESVDGLTFAHLQTILAGIVPKISDIFPRLGLPVPTSKEAITHDVVVSVLRAAVTKAITDPAPKAAATAGNGSSTTNGRPTVSHLAERKTAVAAQRDVVGRPVTTIGGITRTQLEQGGNDALAALFVTLHANGLTAIPALRPWCEAEKLWPADGSFTPDIRQNIAAALLAKIEAPAKIATALHESVPAGT